MPDEANASIPLILNPLLFHQADAALDDPRVQLTCEDVLRHLCSIDLSPEPSAFLDRYKEIRHLNKISLFVAPVSPDILRKFVFPLRDAFVAHLIGACLPRRNCQRWLRGRDGCAAQTQDHNQINQRPASSRLL
jgi:hypothetical protein